MTNQTTPVKVQTTDERPQTTESRPSSIVYRPSFIKATLAIVQKDLSAEFRSRELLSAMLVFSMLVILNRSMAVEKDRGCMDGLLLAPVDRAAIFFGKAISNLAFMLIVEAIVLPLYAMLYNEVRIFQLSFLGVILLGSIGYIAVGTLLSAMSVQTRTRDVLLPILLFPVAVPVLLASVKASGGILNNATFAEILTPLNLLIVYDVIFIAVAFMVFDFVVEE